jgi:4-hydroxybenzoate polyprenyltransferase
MGWTVRMERVDLPSVLLYAGTICWIVGYDTIYAHQDREDDALIGMKSTALRFGDNTKIWLSFFFGLAIVFMFGAVMMVGTGQHPLDIVYSKLTLLVMLTGMGIASGLLAWQVVTLDINDAENCLYRFRHAHVFGSFVFGLLVVMWLLNRP